MSISQAEKELLESHNLTNLLDGLDQVPKEWVKGLSKNIEELERLRKLTEEVIHDVATHRFGEKMSSKCGRLKMTYVKHHHTWEGTWLCNNGERVGVTAFSGVYGFTTSPKSEKDADAFHVAVAEAFSDTYTTTTLLVTDLCNYLSGELTLAKQRTEFMSEYAQMVLYNEAAGSIWYYTTLLQAVYKHQDGTLNNVLSQLTHRNTRNPVTVDEALDLLGAALAATGLSNGVKEEIRSVS